MLQFEKLKSKFSQEFIIDILFANGMFLGTLQPWYIYPMDFKLPTSTLLATICDLWFREVRAVYANYRV